MYKAILCPNRTDSEHVREVHSSPDGPIETQTEDEERHFQEDSEVISNTSPLKQSPADRGFQTFTLILSSYPGLDRLSCLFPLYSYFPTKFCMHFLRLSCNTMAYECA
jgi:hypothetical protein